MWDWIQDQWKIGSILTLLSTLLAGLHRLGGPRRVLIAFRSQWHLNLVIWDLENQIARLQKSEARAVKGEQEANERADEAVTAMQTMLSAAMALKEARDQGFLQISTRSSPVPTPLPGTSTTSRTKPEGPLDLL